MYHRRFHKFKKTMIGLLFLLCLVTVPGITAHAKTKVVTNPTSSMYKNDKYTLELDPALVKESCYNIASSDTSIVAVINWEGRYLLHAKAVGNATVTVTDSLSDQTVQSFQVKVTKPKLKRCFSAVLAVIAPGEKVRVSSKSGWTFTSRFPQIAKVDSKGYVTGLEEGTGFILAEDADGNIDCKEVIVIRNASARKAIKKLEKKYRNAGYVSVDEAVRTLIEKSESAYLSWSGYRESLYDAGLKNGVGWSGIPLKTKADIAYVNSWKISKITPASDSYYIAYYDGYLLQGL